MPVSIENWHAVIGNYNNNPNSYSYRTISDNKSIALVNSIFLELLTLAFILFQQSILLEYSDCFLGLLFLCLFFLIALKDDFVFHVFSLLPIQSPSIKVF